jgi:phage tail-like protein
MKPGRIATLLPEVVQRAAPSGSVIDGLLHVMADQHDPVEDLLADFGRLVDPYRCPAEFVPLLAAWVGFDWLVDRPAGVGRDHPPPRVSESGLRHLVFHAADLAKQRGTAIGLRRTLELATGHRGIEVSAAAQQGFAVQVRAPEAARPELALLAYIVDHDKPAFTTATVAVGDDEPVPAAQVLDRGPGPTPPAPPTDQPNDDTKGDQR